MLTSDLSPFSKITALGDKSALMQHIQGVQTLSDKSNLDNMIGKIGQIPKVKVYS